MNYSFVVASLPYTNSVDSSISAALYGPGLPPRPMRGRRASSFSQTAAGKWAYSVDKLLYIQHFTPPSAMHHSFVRISSVFHFLFCFFELSVYEVFYCFTQYLSRIFT